jgi:HAE1 family hydrophobic/amphiphilic exporter-1
MAFAVGMVVDNSIVVLENIYRHRQMGKSRFDAAHDGASEVWGAVLASTLTTIAVFVPIVFMEEEVGQLFGDIALAIACAVGLSLLVSITVIPSLSAKILGRTVVNERTGGFKNLWGVVNVAQGTTALVSEFIYRMTGSTVARVAVVVLFTAVALGGSWLLMPQTEYLPLGNQNFLFGLLLPPPGYSLDEVVSLQDLVMADIDPLWRHPAGSPEAVEQPGGGIADYFFVALNRMAFMGASGNDPMRVRELLPRFMAVNRMLPGAIFVMTQASLFESGRSEGRNIDVEITGPELTELIGLGGQVFMQVMQKLPDAQARPIPSLDLGNPEVRVRTDRRRAAELGLSHRELGYAVSALVDGAKASDYQHQGKEIDLRLMAEEEAIYRTHLLEQMPIATPDGNLVTLGSVADISVTSGPIEILHNERERSVVIQVTPSMETPLEAAMQMIDTEILDPMRETGQLGGLYQARLSGAAEKLAEAVRTIRWDLLLALAITYLLLSALFESFLYPLVIMFSVPLAALGGFLGLAVVNGLTEDALHLDVLTMLGFVILIGTVVNNAILIVHQSLNHMRSEGMDHRDAIRAAVRNRMRPIFMSVTTSVFGMMPLILFAGAGSELYRGLGSVVVGGLLVSTVFTLVLVPALFSLSLGARAALARRLGGRRAP